MFGAGLDDPVVALSRIVLRSLLFDEGFVQAKVMPDAVLPAGVCGVVEGVGIRDPFVDLGEGQSATGCS